MSSNSTSTATKPAGLRIPQLPSNPYVGLRPFDESESLLFFGRREQTIELLQRLHTHHFIAVVGSSGCGKSSLIRAGLIPKLKAGLLVEDRDQWHIATMKPGATPLLNLASALLRAQNQTPAQASALVESVRTQGVQALLQQLAPALLAADANLLLLVDQFEEIFQYAQFAEAAGNATHLAATRDQRVEAEDFVALMLALAAQTELPIYVVLTMRSDFIGDCDNFFGLPEAFNRSQYLVPRLTRLQRQHAIEGPAQLLGASLTPRLLDRMLNDIGEKDDQLPVLQHALLRTWEEWQRSGAAALDLAHYEAEAVGTIKNALSLDADRALVGMSKEELEITRRMFQALTGTDARNRRVRRRAYLSELAGITGATTTQLDGIIRRFEGDGRCFLLRIPGRTPDDPLIDISHESLIRQWQRLGEWMEREAKSAEMYRRLVDTARRYHRRETKLWRNPDLGLATAWRTAEQPNPSWAQRYETASDFNAVISFLEQSRRWQFYRICLAGFLVLLAVGVLYYFNIELRVQQADAKAKDANYRFEMQRKTNAVVAANKVTQGVALFSEGEHPAAIENFSLAVQLAPDNRDAYFYRGNAYFQGGQNEPALADFQKYLELGGTIEKETKARDFIQKIQHPVAAVPTSAEMDARCSALVEQIFHTDKGTRIAATTALILDWQKYPALVPLVLKQAASQSENKSGVINALVVLQRAERRYLRQHEPELNRLLVKVADNGPQTRIYSEELRRTLREAKGLGAGTAPANSSTQPPPAARH
jgi:tetratricopeptide (TPR) repeat protein